jgi:hypothetical protein
MSLARFMLVWTLLILSAAGTPAQTMDILASVQIYSGAGANGPANLVSNAIPFRAGVVTHAADVRVLDGGVEIPVARLRPSASEAPGQRPIERSSR